MMNGRLKKMIALLWLGGLLNGCVTNKTVEFTSFHKERFTPRKLADMQDRSTADLFLDGYLLLGYIDVERNIQACYETGRCDQQGDVTLTEEELCKSAARKGGDVVTLLEEKTVVRPTVYSYCISSYTQMIKSGDTQIPVQICTSYATVNGQQEVEISRALVWRYSPELAFSDANTQAIERALETLETLVDEEEASRGLANFKNAEERELGETNKGQVEDAIRAERLDELEVLHRTGALASWLDEDGRTPLMYAFYVRRLDAAKKLLALNPGLNDRDQYSNNVMVYALSNGDEKLLDAVLAAGHRIEDYHPNGTPLIFFATNNPLALYWLLAKGADSQLTDERKWTLLHNAASKGNADTIRFLLQQGFDPNQRDINQLTPLMAAAIKGRLAAVELLLAAGAEVNATNKDLNTPLHYAAISNHRDTLKQLLSAGAAINAEDKDGRSPLVDAITGGHWRSANELIGSGAALATESIASVRLALALVEKNNLPLLRHYIKEDASVRASILEEYEHWLERAARHGDVAMVQFLLDRGAPLEGKDPMGNTALIVAAELGKVAIVNVLLEAGADPNSRNGANLTALQSAVRGGQSETVVALRDYGVIQ